MFNQKISSLTDLRNYFQEYKQKYCPPIHDFSLQFAKDLLTESLPLNIGDIWEMVLKNDGLTAYMPEFKDKERIPNPDYFANVLNTIDHGCLTKIAHSYMETKFKQFYINTLPFKDRLQEYKDIEQYLIFPCKEVSNSDNE